MRRIYITLAVLLIGMIGMAYLYFSNLNTETNPNDLSLNAATANSAIVFSFENDKSFYEILSGQDLFQLILGENKAKQFKSLKENLAHQNEISAALSGQKIYISFLPETAGKVDFLISTQLKPKTDPLKILNGLNVKTTINKVANVYQITFADSTNCFVGIKDMLVLISNAPAPIESLFKEKNNNDIAFSNYVKANSRYNKNTLANLYLNYNKAPQLLKSILNSNLTGELSLFNKQSTYAALSYNYSTEKILFNGTTTINEANNYYKLFTSLAEQKIIINTILPAKTANYAIYSINDYTKWYPKLTNWFAQKKQKDKIEKDIETINQKYRVDLGQILPKYFKNQFITFQLYTGEKFGAVALNNGEKLNQLLLDLSTEYASDIRIFKDPNIPYSFFGEPFKKFERPFYTIIDNYLIMANNASSIQAFINSYSNNDLLINNEDYINFNDQLSSSATICFYVNNKNSNLIFSRNLKMPFYKQYQSTNGFRDFDAFSYQLSGDNDKFLTNLLLYKKQEKAIVPDTLKANP
ncbi:hypothetical protein FA048_10660 [Pedobacter polaris]|uniref:DUF3352 domain-containing protein n=1 Tax=Pedobacter polaris TaxID=2571273 RepID=A0A4U1CU37_9SPHI|nr:hypothetical protein [Pedobacter polaris]TKC10630.1 hypothetical protein FA048_10660 [Pedobacter polaris]